MVRLATITLWYHSLVSPSHITLSYHSLVSPACTTPSYNPLLSPSRITLSYHPLLSPSHITLSYHPLLSPSRITLSYHHLVSPSRITHLAIRFVVKWSVQLKVAVSQDFSTSICFHKSNPSGPLINRLKWFCKFVFAKIFEFKVRKIWLCAVLYWVE